MALLRICERAGLGDGANAELSFEHTETYPITISDPFAEEDERHLEWYFEDWLIMPFANTVEAQAIAASTVTYGETLFRQVFADRDAYGRYKQLDLKTLERKRVVHGLKMWSNNTKSARVGLLFGSYVLQKLSRFLGTYFTRLAFSTEVAVVHFLPLQLPLMRR